MNFICKIFKMKSWVEREESLKATSSRTWNLNKDSENTLVILSFFSNSDDARDETLPQNKSISN